jgi:poly [ADP-ribose] polymerase
VYRSLVAATTIEIAKSGRATCRACKKPIAKGELRFGLEGTGGFVDASTPTFMWHHLVCAAGKHPDETRAALAAYEGDIPDRAAVDAKLAEAEAKKPPPFPHADRAPTGRARCLECGEAIPKGALRVAIERDIERGMTTTKGAGYLHPACAAAYVESQGSTHDELTAAIQANTRDLSEADLAEIFSVV